MKIIYLLPFLILGCHSGDKNMKKVSATSYQAVFCKQKALPLKMESKELENSLSIKITAEAEIANLEVSNVRGLDGLNVINFTPPAVQDLSRGDVFEFVVDIKKPSGRSYLAIETTGMINGLTKKQYVSVKVGDLSEAQKADKSKNIRTEKVPSENGNGSALSTEPSEQKVHILKIE